MKMTREGWLIRMKDLMKPKFENLGYPLPDNIRLSCGFPGSGDRGRAVGQIWQPTSSSGDFFEIFIRPDRDDSVDVAGILCHELIHAVLPRGSGHGKDFRRLALLFGLLPPMRSTENGKDFVVWATGLIDEIGEYPHKKMILGIDRDRGAKPIPHVNLRCPNCYYYAKTTTDMDAMARLKCPVCPNQELLYKGQKR